MCRCDCGNERIVNGNYLKGNITRSCGCLKKEQDNINIVKPKHYMSNTRIYNIWRHMKNRCNNPNNKKHKFYYDKGIRVCDEWEKDFMTFYNWAITNGYKDNLTIDRINNNKNYEPGNCRWATYEEQNNNQSNNIKINYKGETYTTREFSKQYNIDYRLLTSRIKYRLGY